MLNKIAGAVVLMALVTSCAQPSTAADKSSDKSNASDSESKAADAKLKTADGKSKDKSKSDPLKGNDKSKVSIVYDHALPNVPGKSIKGVLVEYAPGGFSPPHCHPKSAFIYATVLEGAIKSSVNGGPVKTYKQGENFSENPGDEHGVSANASKTKPAKLLAVFVLNTDEKELTTVCGKK
jgi:Uncharacterized conserved protein, contains double-stranded beta-helix domain